MHEYKNKEWYDAYLCDRPQLRLKLNYSYNFKKINIIRTTHLRKIKILIQPSYS